MRCALDCLRFLPTATKAILWSANRARCALPWGCIFAMIALTALTRHPRLVEPALQILGEPAYIQQVKVNVKAAFSGEVWQWHYDFATHHEEDGVLRPLALNLHVFLDDVSEFNGPLWFIPGSHAVGAHGAHLDTATTSYPLWVVIRPR